MNKSFFVIALISWAAMSLSALAANTITAITVTTNSATQATVKYTTSTAVASQVKYGATSSYGKSVTASSKVKAHSVVITGLKASTTYHYQIVAGAVVSPDATFSTPAKAGASPSPSPSPSASPSAKPSSAPSPTVSASPSSKPSSAPSSSPSPTASPLIEGYVSDIASYGFDMNCGMTNTVEDEEYGCLPVTTTGAKIVANGQTLQPGVYIRIYGSFDASNLPMVLATEVDYSATAFSGSPTIPAGQPTLPPAPSPSPSVTPSPSPTPTQTPLIEGYVSDIASYGFDMNCGMTNTVQGTAYGCLPVTTTNSILMNNGQILQAGVYVRIYGSYSATNLPMIMATEVDLSATPFAGSPTIPAGQPTLPTPAPSPSPSPSPSPTNSATPLILGYVSDVASYGFDMNCGMTNTVQGTAYGCLPVTTSGAKIVANGQTLQAGVYVRIYGSYDSSNLPMILATEVDYSATPYSGSPTIPAPTSTPTPTATSSPAPISSGSPVNGVNWGSSFIPYSPQSIWNKPLSGTTHTYSSDSASILASQFPSTSNMESEWTSQEPGEYDPSVQVYFATSSDPVVNINCSPGGCGSTLPSTMHIPAKAHINASNNDNIMAIIQPDGTELDFYCWDVYDGKTCEPPNWTGQGTGSWSTGDTYTVGGISTNCGNFYTGAGFNGATSPSDGAHAYGYGAGGNCAAAGLMDPSELASGVINHAISITAGCTMNNSVFPAYWITGGGNPCSGAPAPSVGYRLWYDVSCADTQANSSLYPWEKGVLCALNQYGGFIMDNGSDSGGMPPGIGWRQMGEVPAYMYGSGDQWAQLTSQGWSPFNVGGDWTSSLPRYGITSHSDSNGNWTPPGVDPKDHFHYLDPCVTEGTCQ